jgi:hypothetical protein
MSEIRGQGSSVRDSLHELGVMISKEIARGHLMPTHRNAMDGARWSFW